MVTRNFTSQILYQKTLPEEQKIKEYPNSKNFVILVTEAMNDYLNGLLIYRLKGIWWRLGTKKINITKEI